MQTKVYPAEVGSCHFADSYGAGTMAVDLPARIEGTNLVARRVTRIYLFGRRSERRVTFEVLGLHGKPASKDGRPGIRVGTIPFAHEVIRRKAAAALGVEPESVVILD